MARLFFLLSGEHPTLPQAELTSILEAEGHRYRVLEKLTQVLRVEAEAGCIESVVRRSAMTRLCGIELVSCNAVSGEILRETGSVPFEEFIEGGESFVVRVRRVRESAPHLIGGELERRLGELVLNRVKGAKVNLTSPQKTFFGVLTEDRFVFGLKTAEIPARSFVERRPRKRPFFHPTAMPAKLARCMVNLAQPKAGELVLDPFCGTASLLIEAGLMGCRVMGLDVKRRMVEGSLRNLRHYGVKPEGMAVADARHPPVTRVDCVVTDPPYGRSATTLGWSTRQIVKRFLAVIGETLPRGRRVCMASPKSIRIGSMGEAWGLKHIDSHFAYVHRSLTREIAVFERT